MEQALVGVGILSGVFTLGSYDLAIAAMKPVLEA